METDVKLWKIQENICECEYAVKWNSLDSERGRFNDLMNDASGELAQIARPEVATVFSVKCRVFAFTFTIFYISYHELKNCWTLKTCFFHLENHLQKVKFSLFGKWREHFALADLENSKKHSTELSKVSKVSRNPTRLDRLKIFMRFSPAPSVWKAWLSTFKRVSFAMNFWQDNPC